MLPAIAFASAIRRALVRSFASWLNIALLLPGGAMSAACPSDVVAKAASIMGYGPAPGGKYCEGLLQEMHSAQMTVQVFQFATVTDSLLGATAIYIGIPTARSQTVLEVTGLAAYAPYRFDAVLATGSKVRLDLEKIIVPARIAVSSLGFVARRQDMPSMLLPVLLSGRAEHGIVQAYLFGIRSNLQVAEISYSVVDEAGAIRYKRKFLHDFAPAEMIPLQIGFLPSGRYGLTVRARQTPDDPARDALLFQRFTIP